MEIDDIEPYTMFDFALAQFVQVRPPSAILREIIGDSFREQNVPSVAAIHNALRHGDAGAGHIRALVYIHNFIDRSAVNAHANRKFGRARNDY